MMSSKSLRIGINNTVQGQIQGGGPGGPDPPFWPHIILLITFYDVEVMHGALHGHLYTVAN